MLTMLLLMGCPLVSDADLEAKLTPPGDTQVDDSGVIDTASDSGGNDSADSGAVDADEDGYAADVDCNDDDAAIHPDADEVWYDGVDQDCDARNDYDQDGDGYTSSDHGGDDCADDPLTPPDVLSGFPVLIAAEVNPSADELWYDGVDQDCGSDDDFDRDADGVRAQGQPDATGADGTDCNDLDPLVAPGLAEVWYDGVDGDCDAANDYDQDGDGDCPRAYAGIDRCSVYDSDCNDDPSSDSVALSGFSDLPAASVRRGAVEIWYDGIDGNCDGEDDFDADGDGHRSDAVDDERSMRGEDCDDGDRAISPSAAEFWYDGVDDDCDGNDGDEDGDGYCRVAYAYTLGCDLGSGDCADNPAAALPTLDGSVVLAAEVNPGATEVWYDGVDQRCDGGDDFDQDGDGTATDEVASASGSVGTDCDDLDPALSPLLPEIWYDGIDERCDGGDDFDADGDSFAALAGGGTDCDDDAPAVYPGATETCRTPEDDDCDGSTNEVGATACTAFFIDADGDGYGTTLGQCMCDPSGAYTASVDTDCLDTSSATSPGVAEVCNDRVDNNCDGLGCRLSDHLGDFSRTSTVTPHYYGGAMDGQVGSVVAGVRDWNGDGMRDYVIGAPYIGNGTVYLVTGSTASAGGSLAPFRAFTAEAAVDGVGSALSGAFDVNGDGDSDFVVGAPGHNSGTVVAGAAYLVLGNRVGPGSLSGATKFTGVSAGDRAGESVAGLGNFDGDTYADVVVAAPGVSSGAGIAYVGLGAATLTGGSLSSAVTYTGTALYKVSKVGAAGDTNGDGLADLLIGDPFNGRVMVVYGSGAPVSLTLNSTLFGATPATTAVAFTASGVSGGFGMVISGAGDIDADGYGDVLVGVPGYSGGQGALVVVRGEASPVSHIVDSSFIFATGFAGENLGAAVSSAGDMDDDGYMDVLVGAPSVMPGANLTTASTTSGSTRGRVNLYYGSSRGLTSSGSLSWNGLTNGNYLGYSVAGITDVNGDGYRDLLFGEPGNDEGGARAGAAYLVRGFGL